MHYLLQRQGRLRFLWLLVVAVLAQNRLPTAANELLVYYANETSPEGAEAANYQQFEQWFGALPTEKATNVLKYLRRDREEFRAVVERETAALAHAPIPVLVFQNALARQGRFLEYRPAVGKTNTATLIPFLELKLVEDPVYRANPLASNEGLDAALRAVCRVAERDGITLVGLIVKSHGSPQMALTPRLALWHTEVRQEELPSLLERNEPDPTKPLRGITREQLVDGLNAFQRQWGKPVEFLFTESCRVNAPELRAQLNPGFRRLFAGIEQKMEYQTLDYTALVQTCGSDGVGFLTGFADELKHHPKLMELRLIPWPQRLLANWMYFVPLALALVWAAGRWLTSLKKPPTNPCTSQA